MHDEREYREGRGVGEDLGAQLADRAELHEEHRSGGDPEREEE